MNKGEQPGVRYYMEHHHIHHAVSGRRLFWAIVFNLVIATAELVGGLLTGYLALVADAFHNLSDVAALALAWLGVKGAQLPPTPRSTYGFKRIEVMTAFISAVALVVIAVFILFAAYERLVAPEPITNPALFLTVAFIGLAGNIVSIGLLRTEKEKSLNMKTAFLHMAFDAISSVAVVIGGFVIMSTGLVVIDVILSSLIALMIFWSSYLVIKEAVLIFMESVPSDIDFDEVLSAVGKIPRVENVHHLHIWSLSSVEAALSCHVCVDETDVPSGPEIVSDINRMLRERFRIGHATIQLEKLQNNRIGALCGQPKRHQE